MYGLKVLKEFSQTNSFGGEKCYLIEVIITFSSGFYFCTLAWRNQTLLFGCRNMGVVFYNQCDESPPDSPLGDKGVELFIMLRYVYAK